MNLKFEGSSITYRYQDLSPNAEWTDYVRGDSEHGNWQVRMGESWEYLYGDDEKELEAFHQQQISLIQRPK